MQSKLAMQQRLALLAAVRRLTPEQRLDAFLAHSRLMAELYRAPSPTSMVWSWQSAPAMSAADASETPGPPCSGPDTGPVRKAMSSASAVNTPSVPAKT